MKRNLALPIAIAFLLGQAAAIAGDLRAKVRDQNGQAVEDAVVLAMPVDRSLLQGARPARNSVDQINKDFVPYVKAVYVGTLVRFPNKDNIRHHVYSFSPAKKFELPLYSGTAAPPVLFDKPGVVVLGCNIHDWMVGYIYVADTPYFATTEKDGLAVIDGLPAGDYLVRVWHPDMEGTEQATTRRLSLPDAQASSDEWSLSLKPSFRIPRPLGGQGFGYR